MASEGSRVLGDWFTLQRGTTYKSRLLDAPGPVLLGLATIQRNGGFRADSLRTYGGESPAKLLVQPGELYLSLKDVTQSADLLGAVARLPVDHAPGRLTQDTVKLEPRSRGVPLDYLYWLLRTPQYRSYCRAHATGTTNLGLARDDFLAFPAPEPTRAQRRIVETLGALEDKIELNRRMSRTLESMARIYVDRAVADRPMVPYGSALEVRMGAPFKGAGFSAPGNGRPLLRIRDLKTFASGTWTTEIRGDETTIDRGDIVAGMDAEFRATLWLGEESVLNQRVCSFRGIDGVGRAFVIAAVGPDLEFQEQAKTGTTVIHLNRADIDTFTVPELSASEHRHLTAATEPLIELVVANSIQNRSLIAIRDALIARLLSNRIRVPQEVSA